MIDHELAREHTQDLLREAARAQLAAAARAASRAGARPDASQPRLRLPLRLRRLVAAPWFAAPRPCDGVEAR